MHPFFVHLHMKNTTIQQYSELLLKEKDVERINKLNIEISNELESGEVQDLSLFFLQKDLLKLQCKYAIAYFSHDPQKMEMLNKKIVSISDELKLKVKDKKKVDQYENFISWLFQVEKYAGHSIDKTNTIYYLVLATKQMIKHYENQK